MIDTQALRKKVVDLAIQGKLAEQLPEDGDAETLYAQIQEEKAKLIEEGKIKKEKPLPEIEEDEMPFEIPTNWKWVRLYEISDTNIGLTYHPEDIVDEGIVVLRSNNIKNGVFDYSDLVHVNCEVRENQYIRQNDILICSRNGSKNLVGKRAIYDGELGEVSFGAFMAILRTSLYKYVYYYLTTNLFRRYFSNDDTKQINQVTQDILKKAIVPLPPLKEQKRIVDKLENVLSKIDIIDDLQTNYSNDHAVLKSKIIDAGVQGKLTEQLLEDGNAEDLYAEIQKEKTRLIEVGKIKKEKTLSKITDGEIPFQIPDNWKWVRLGGLSSKISSGNTPAGGKKSNAYVEQGYCFFREQNIYDDGIHEEGLVYITEELLNTRANSTVLPKDILLNITGGSIGRCALIPDDFTKGSINQHILIIRMVDPRLRFFVHSYLCSPQGQKYIKGNSVGDKDGFSATRCKNMLIPLPPIEEQNRIVTNLNAFLNCIN